MKNKKDLHGHSVSTEGIENVGGSGKVQHKFGRTGMCHTLRLHNNTNRFKPHFKLKTELIDGVTYLAMKKCGNGKVPSGVGCHGKAKE